ncbi:hypothetical protein ETH99_09670 [Macrococcoides caseolyticum]|uniref:hypothetical protein n=1 Tax=Macrococcoides caseolyticum TaxID=69966 RepID=UPI00105FBA1C|nr:hypothetical protein [Macrococcus caseolyticus]TDM25629.1 hypothetical protein ETH99_09670 [Macrococcus caseolyticus]
MDKIWAFLTKNIYFLFDVNIIILIIIFMIISIYLKNIGKIFTEIVWIYSSLIPAMTILFLNHEPKLIWIIIFFILQILFLFLYLQSIRNNYKKVVNNTTTPLSKIGKIYNKDVGKEKSLEYVGLFILPFITVNNSVSILAIIMIIVIVIVIIKRFGLFYLNLPILLFGRLQYLETNRRVKMTVLTPRNFTFQENELYDIRSFIKSLNLYIYIPDTKN